MHHLAGSEHACTDITGFGLLGHLSEVAAASRVTIRLDVGAVPLLPGACDLAPANRPGGSANNQAHFGPQIEEPRDLDGNLRALLYDPQTSGGLLASVDPGAADDLVRQLRAAGATAARVGEVHEPGAVLVRLV